MPLAASPAGWPLDQGEDADLLLEAAYGLPPRPDRHVGVAVSGGGDSVALLHLMARACRHWDVPVSAVTVDHRLRTGSRAEADGVAVLCASLGVPHRTVVWDHGTVPGNLMDAARRARRTLIAAWALEAGVTQVALGHTADDNAETFLMALSRAAGLDGLAGMRSGWCEDGLWWGRPLLQVTRADLRRYLRRHGIGWVEDPTNADTRFERVRARQAMAALTPLGIDAARVARSASHLAIARAALRDILRQSCAAHVQEVAGALRIDRSGFDALPHDLQRLLLVAAVEWLSGDARPLRRDRQANLLFGVFGLMIGVLLFSLLFSRTVLRKLSVRRILPDAATVGRPCVISYEIRNTKRFWPSMSVTLAELDGVEAFVRQPHAYMLHAAAGMTAVVPAEVLPRRRGTF
ncbi:MAG TPA: tRNA lysidine(34) synthetase TilS, partial [Paracoccaceae bacterium]|nr:tRNA lysidine(34) synthetase TilS [Paracoccaceae bacterium]